MREAGRRLRKAQAAYRRFAATSRLGSELVPHRAEEMLSAQKELQAAEADFRKVYEERLRRDPEFKKRSDAVEQDLAHGPPWDDAFSPRELLNERGESER